MGKIIKSFFGGAPKAQAPAPVSVAPVMDIADDQTKQGKKARAALYGTEGGIQGQELTSGQVGQRPTLLGN
jgi:hypothetical protein